MDEQRFYSGSLHKWTNVVHGWQSRWCVLDRVNCILRYYVSEEQERKNEVKNTILLKKAEIYLDDNQDEYIFKIITPSTDVYHFQARSLNERDKWVGMMEHSIYIQQKISKQRSIKNHFNLRDFQNKLDETENYLGLLIESYQMLRTKIEDVYPERRYYDKLSNEDSPSKLIPLTISTLATTTTTTTLPTAASSSIVGTTMKTSEKKQTKKNKKVKDRKKTIRQLTATISLEETSDKQNKLARTSSYSSPRLSMNNVEINNLMEHNSFRSKSFRNSCHQMSSSAPVEVEMLKKSVDTISVEATPGERLKTELWTLGPDMLSEEEFLSPLSQHGKQLVNVLQTYCDSIQHAIVSLKLAKTLCDSDIRLSADEIDDIYKQLLLCQVEKSIKSKNYKISVPIKSIFYESGNQPSNELNNRLINPKNNYLGDQNGNAKIPVRNTPDNGTNEEIDRDHHDDDDDDDDELYIDAFSEFINPTCISGTPEESSEQEPYDNVKEEKIDNGPTDGFNETDWNEEPNCRDEENMIQNENNNGNSVRKYQASRNDATISELDTHLSYCSVKSLSMEEIQNKFQDVNQLLWYDELNENLDDNNDINKCVVENCSVIRHLLSQLSIGMDLTRVTLPTFILERNSTLEMFANFIAHPDIFLACNKGETAKDRMIAVTRWYLGSFHASRKSTVPKKPYNPVLGEIFQCFYADNEDNTKDRFRRESKSNLIQNQTDYLIGDDGRPVPWASSEDLSFIAEQVSHHPPVSAFYAECPKERMEIMGQIYTKSKFYGLSLAVHLVGHTYLNLLNFEEEYEFSFPSAFGRGLFGSPWFEMAGEVSINCKKTGYYSKIDFHPKPFYGGKKHQIHAGIFHQKDKKPFLTITGEWNGLMTIKNPIKSNHSDVFFDTIKTPVHRKLVRPLKLQHETESRKLWRNVTEHLQYGRLDEATNEKSAIEGKQRTELKERQTKSEEWKTKYFDKDDQRGWVYKFPLSQRLAASAQVTE
ncbi:hypothetical protein SNEBB_009364 [Seison nebaliae]|nr:hypothetical protein SNEBB_009364 [Seison nebaliae]